MRYALRSLAKSPGFTLVAALTLALGIGANTTFFSVLYGVVLRGLPYPNSGDLVELSNTGPVLGSNLGRISLAELRDYRARQRSLTEIGAYNIGRITLNLDEGAERIVRTRVTANLFSLLGVTPAFGRGFDESEERPGNDLAIVVSHEFWQTHLGGAPDVLGRTLRANGVLHTVVGVMPAGFSFADSATAIWQPLDFSPRGPADRTDRYLTTIARLAPGISLARARADLQRVARQLRADSPDAYPDAQWSLALVPLREAYFGQMFARLATLVAAAGAVLLIASVNVAIMFLLRAAARRRDIMICLSLGASRWHIVRQSLAESVVVCALGGIAGLAFACAGIEVLKAFPPADIPRLQEVGLNLPVAAFNFGVLALVTVMIGLAPALPVFKTRISEGIAHTGRSTETRAAVRLREALTVIEIALAVTLLVCGGLALRSLQNLLRDDVGYATTHLFTFKTNLTAEAYPPAERGRVDRFYEQLLAKIEALPGVNAVAAVSYLPLSAESSFITAAPVAQDAAAPAPTFAWRIVRGPYFSVMDSTLLHGRLFNRTDQTNSPLVAIVDDAFARRFWSEPADAVGEPVRFGGEIRTIVGVVRQLKHNGPGQESAPEAFAPHTQVYQRGMYSVVKTSTPPAALAPLIRARLAEVDPTVPMYFIETMERRYASALALPRFTAGLIGAFSVLALVLAAVGIFGVTAYSVAQRSREFGIRFAIGAPRTHVVRLVLGRVAWLALIGSALGALAANGFAQLMASVLFGVEPTDTPALLAAATLVALAALVATIVPLRRALRVNPADALRAE